MNFNVLKKRRPLYDNSNQQIYLDSSIEKSSSLLHAKNSIAAPSITVLDSEDDNEEDDMLLSQALDNHQEILRSQQQQQLTNKKNTKDQSPPAKKMRSLVQSLFDDDEDEGDGDADGEDTILAEKSTTRSKSVQINSSKGISITNLLDSSSSSCEEEDYVQNRTKSGAHVSSDESSDSDVRINAKKHHASVYIEETDSE
jgi:hypothetical protein